MKKFTSVVLKRIAVKSITRSAPQKPMGTSAGLTGSSLAARVPAKRLESSAATQESGTANS
eukprot:6285461-Alexandrium_andersonii.AAC.1